MGAVFDFSRVGRKWNKQFMATTVKAARAQVVMQRPAPSDPDRLDAHYDRVEQAITDLESIMDEQAALVAQVLIDVPTDWLIDGTPEDLDFSDVDDLDFIQSGYYSQILQELQSGIATKQKAASTEAKN